MVTGVILPLLLLILR